MAVEQEMLRMFPKKFQFSFIVDETFTLNVIEDTSDDDPRFETTKVSVIEDHEATNPQADTSEQCALQNDTSNLNGLVDRTRQPLDQDSESELVIDLGPHEENDAEERNENRENELPTILEEFNKNNENELPTISNISTSTNNLVEKNQPQPHLTVPDAASSTKNTTNSTSMYQCSVCSYKTKNPSRFSKHCDQHDAASFNCPGCPFKANSMAKLRHHQLYCKENKDKFPCPYCHITTMKLTSLKKHMRSYHSDNPVFTCTKCPFSTGRWSLVEKHKKRHEKQLFKCGLCSFETLDRTLLKKHHSMNHSLKCESCSFRTSSPEALAKHKQCHVINNAQNLKCKFCPFMDSVAEIVKKHEENHKRRKP